MGYNRRGPDLNMHVQALMMAAFPPAASSPTLLAHTLGLSGAPGTVTSPAIDTTGATFLVVCGSFYGPSVPPSMSVSDSKSNTWTAVVTLGTGSDAYVYYSVCYSPASVGSGHTFTTTHAFNIYAPIMVLAFSGITTSSVNTSAGTTTSSTTTFQSGSVTPSVAKTLMIAFGGWDGTAGTVSIGSSYTLTDQTDSGGGVNLGSSAAYKVLTSASAQNPTWTASSSVASAAAGILSFAY